MPRSTRLTFTRLLREEAGRDQQRHRERDLRRRQRRAEPRGAARAPDGWPACPFSVESRSGRVLCSAGNRPNRRPVPSVSAPRRAAPVPSIVERERRGRLGRQHRGDQVAASTAPRPGPRRRRARRAAAIRRAAGAIELPRLAPIDSRTAISLARAGARAPAAGWRCSRRRSAARSR